MTNAQPPAACPICLSPITTAGVGVNPRMLTKTHYECGAVWMDGLQEARGDHGWYYACSFAQARAIELLAALERQADLVKWTVEADTAYQALGRLNSPQTIDEWDVQRAARQRWNDAVAYRIQAVAAYLAALP